MSIQCQEMEQLGSSALDSKSWVCEFAGCTSIHCCGLSLDICWLRKYLFQRKDVSAMWKVGTPLAYRKDSTAYLIMPWIPDSKILGREIGSSGLSGLQSSGYLFFVWGVAFTGLHRPHLMYLSGYKATILQCHDELRNWNYFEMAYFFFFLP